MSLYKQLQTFWLLVLKQYSVTISYIALIGYMQARHYFI